MLNDILPDSRAKITRHRVFQGGVAWVPVYCANCGKDGGLVPEENMTFVFYQCQPCADKTGPLLDHYKMPDEVFFEKVKQEQIAAYGRYLTPEEIGAVIENNDTPLAKLLLKK